MMGDMADPSDMMRDARRGMDLSGFKKLMHSIPKMPEMPSAEDMKKMAEASGGKIHSESSSMGSSMKCENGKCEKTVCKNGKCKSQLVAQPGAGEQGG